MGFVLRKMLPGCADACPWELAAGIGALLANAPDIDTLIAVPFVPKAVRKRYPLIDHRGITHSVWMVPVWAAAGALLFAMCGAQACFLSLFLLGSLCCASHLVLDMVDGSTGVMLFAGLHNRYYRLPLSLVRDIDVLTAGPGEVPPATPGNICLRVFEETVFAVAPLNMIFVLMNRFI